ncbi:MAG: HEAT repeat domain-containing protein [Planctomycetes bacterium]|nr:HEAT repeat domain-containing protein [Planctomycetota bacterium]
MIARIDQFLKPGVSVVPMNVLLPEVRSTLEVLSVEGGRDAFARVLAAFTGLLDESRPDVRDRAVNLLYELAKRGGAAIRREFFAGILGPLAERLRLETFESLFGTLVEVAHHAIRYFLEQEDLESIGRLVWEVALHRTPEGARAGTASGVRLRVGGVLKQLAASAVTDVAVENLSAAAPERREQARRILTALGPGVAGRLLAFLKRAEDPAARRSAAFALKSLGAPAEQEALREINPVAPPAGMARVLSVLDVIAGELAVPIGLGLRHGDESVRRETVALLGRIDRGAAVKAVLAALKDDDPAVVRAAVAVVTEHRFVELAPQLAAVLAASKDAALGKEICLALGKIPDLTAIPALAGVLTRSGMLGGFGAAPEELRVAAAWALGNYAHADARAALTKATSDAAASVRSAAKLALRATEPPAGPAAANP